MADDVLISCEGVSKKFCRSLKRSLWYGVADMAREVAGAGTRHDRLRKDEFWAVDDVSFELRRGECLGLIGHNGAGKTTLLKMLNGLIKPDSGEIRLRGRVGALIALGAGFNPVLTGRENIYVNGTVLGLTKREIDAKIHEIIDFAEIRDFIDSPVQNYSSGMGVRLGFAIATALEPDVLLLDEILAVGDAAFRNKCYQRISALRKQAAIVFVSHSMEQVARICDTCVVLAHGRVTYFGSPEAGVNVYESMNAGSDTDASFLSVRPPVKTFQLELLGNEIRSGGRLLITANIECTHIVRHCHIRVLLYNAHGAIAADCDFAAFQYGLADFQGNGEWQIAIHPVSLKNGTYRVAFIILDSHGDVLVWSYKQHTITVSGAFAGAVSDCQLGLESWTQELLGTN